MNGSKQEDMKEIYILSNQECFMLRVDISFFFNMTVHMAINAKPFFCQNPLFS